MRQYHLSFVWPHKTARNAARQSAAYAFKYCADAWNTTNFFEIAEELSNQKKKKKTFAGRQLFYLRLLIAAEDSRFTWLKQVFFRTVIQRCQIVSTVMQTLLRGTCWIFQRIVASHLQISQKRWTIRRPRRRSSFAPRARAKWISLHFCAPVDLRHRAKQRKHLTAVKVICIQTRTDRTDLLP